MQRYLTEDPRRQPLSSLSLPSDSESSQAHLPSALQHQKIEHPTVITRESSEAATYGSSPIAETSEAIHRQDNLKCDPDITTQRVDKRLEALPEHGLIGTCQPHHISRSETRILQDATTSHRTRAQLSPSSHCAKGGRHGAERHGKKSIEHDLLYVGGMFDPDSKAGTKTSCKQGTRSRRAWRCGYRLKSVAGPGKSTC